MTADVTLAYSNVDQPGGTVNVHQVNVAWIEGNGVFGGPGVTWDSFYGGQLQPNPITQFEATPFASFTALQDPSVQMVTFDVTAQVQAWVSLVGAPNFGMLIEEPSQLLPSPIAQSITILSSEDATQGFRPALNVCWFSPPTTDVLEFLDDGGNVIVGESVPPGQSYGWASGALAPLPSVPLAGGFSASHNVTLSYTSPVSTTDVEMFARDPDEQDGAFLFLAQQQIILAEVSGGQAVMDNWPGAQGIVDVPQVFVVPYPPANGPLFGPADPPLLQDLITPQFFGNNITPDPAGPAAQPVPPGNSSIKAVRINDHGACSNVQDLGPIYDTINSDAWMGYACGIIDLQAQQSIFVDGPYPFMNYSHVMTHLDNGSTPTMPTGGFTLDLNYGFNAMAVLGISETEEDYFEASYVFGLNNGVLNATNVDISWSTNGPGAVQCGKCSEALAAVCNAPTQYIDGVPQFVCCEDDVTTEGYTALTATLPATLDAQALSLQAKDFYGLAHQGQAEDTCNPVDAAGDVDMVQCNASVNLMKGAIGTGVQTDASLSGQAQQALIDALQATVRSSNPNTTYWVHWTCAPSSTSNGANVCQFVIPAKRLNVYPDQVELVWFDSNLEGDNAAAAFWWALSSSQLGIYEQDQFKRMLCNYVQPTVPYARQYATSDLVVPFGSPACPPPSPPAPLCQ